MKKIYLLLIALVFLTGCSATYNLKLDGNHISENIYTSVSSDELNKEYYGETIDSKMEHIYNHPYPLRYNDYTPGYSDDEVPQYGQYSIISYDYNSNNSSKILNAIGNFTFEDFEYSTAVNMCYDYVLVKREGYESSIYTSSVAKCFENYDYLDEVTINITLENTVTETNADMVDGNVYTWKINRDNYSSKSIEIVFQTNSQNVDEEQSIFSNNQALILIIVVASILILAGLVYLYLSLRNKKANKL